jgi:hypothetical protein
MEKWNMVKRYGFNPGSNAIHERADGIYVAHRDYEALAAAFSRWKAETSKDVARLAELNAELKATRKARDKYAKEAGEADAAYAAVKKDRDAWYFECRGRDYQTDFPPSGLAEPKKP